MLRDGEGSSMGLGFEIWEAQIMFTSRDNEQGVSEPSRVLRRLRCSLWVSEGEIGRVGLGRGLGPELVKETKWRRSRWL